MFLKFITYLSLVYLYFGLVFAKCPPESEIQPYCYCDDTELFLGCRHPDDDNETWDIKAYFDKLGKLIPEDTIFEGLHISYTQLKEIPAGAVKTIKARNISIHLNDKLEFIHPDSFEATLEITTILAVTQNELLTNQGPGHTPYDVFNFVNKFKNLEELFMESNKITVFPENALGPLNNLVYFKFGYDSNHGDILKRMESKIFSQLPKLQSLVLSYADIMLEKLAPDTFEGMAPGAQVDLRANHLWELPKTVFKVLLDNAKTIYFDGGNYFGCSETSSWICEDLPKYQNKLDGFLAELVGKTRTSLNIVRKRRLGIERHLK